MRYLLRPTPSMQPKDLELTKKQLEEERAKLMQELADHSHPVPLEDETGSNVDPEVQADEAEEFSNRLGVADALRARINEIDASINKINSGTYGKCERCGAQLTEEELKASPARRHCVKCQRELNQ